MSSKQKKILKPKPTVNEIIDHAISPQPKTSIGNFFNLIWQALGSTHFANFISLATLGVTVYLTLYVFEYTQKQEESKVEISIDVSPKFNLPNAIDYSGITRNEWNINVNMHNFGPSDIQTSSFFIDFQDNPATKLIGFEQKDWLAMVSEPKWLDPAPTPAYDYSHDYLTVLSNFENGGNFAVRLVIEVNGNVNAELLADWNALGIKEVPSSSGSGFYYDRSDIDHDAYIRFLQFFIRHVNLTGQNVHTYGDVP
jgi:hypothetical protein